MGARKLDLARAMRVLVVLVCVLTGCLVFAGVPAFAALSYPLDGHLAPAGSSFGELGANSVAVDDADGDTYVADRGGSAVDVFATVTGAPVGSLEGSLTPAGSFSGAAQTPIAVAASNASGDVYVSDAAHNVVDVFEADGAYRCQITGSSTPSASECNGVAGSDTPAHGFKRPRGVAVDQATGDVYVMDEENGVVDVFSVGGAYLRQVVLSSVPGGFEHANAIAVGDFNGDLYVVDAGRKVVDVFDSGGVWVAAWTGENTPGGSFGGGEPSVAVDDASGTVYVSDNAHKVVDVFEASGVYVTQIKGFVAPFGVAVGQASHRVWVSDDNGSVGSVDILGPGVVVPGVVTGVASEVGSTSATLNGAVNPAGIELKDCRFEYGSEVSYGLEYGSEVSYGQSVPCVPAAGAIPVDSSEHAVSAHVTGLQPGVTYHFRLVAANANDLSAPSAGEDATFPTPPAPSIEGAAAVNVTREAADLTARIDPNGFDTTYRFEWGTSTAYGTRVPVPDADIGAGSVGVPVSTHLSGLHADKTTYHWRIVATNENGTTTGGGDHTFVYDTTGGGLPDNRAYEMVTPPQKNGAAIDTGAFIYLPGISEDGSRVVDFSIQCFAGAASCTGDRLSFEGEPFAFTRTGGGWVTTPLAPPATQFRGNIYKSFSADTGAVLFQVATAPSGEEALYVRKPDGSFSAIGPQPLYEPFTLGTADFSHVLVEDISGLAEGVPTAVYEYVGAGNAQPALVGVSGGLGSTDLISACGTGVAGLLPGSLLGTPGALSANGDVVFFTAEKCASGAGVNAGMPVPARELYARIGESRSVLLSGRSPLDCTSAECLASPSSDAAFEGASADGSRVFFLSTQQLTDSASEDNSDSAKGEGSCAKTTGVGGCNLYEYDFSSPAGHNLVATSAGDSSGSGPRVQGVVAVSGDGSHVYFVAKGVLTGVANSQGQLARDGAENLYVFERDADYPTGRVAFIGALSGENIGGDGSDSLQWIEAPLVANVTPDGRFLVFTSRERLTVDDTSTTGAAQVFRYDAQTGGLVRISIGERGFNDNGNANMRSATIAQPRLGTVSGSVPRRSDPTMSHDGSFVFFESPVGLTPGALNEVPIGGVRDAGNVYEWHEGHVYLISDGRDTAQFSGNEYLAQRIGGGSAVVLLGSDGSGANVFFTTADSLVAQDTDSGLDIYDARVCTASDPCVPSASASVGACEGEACHGMPAGAPVFGAPGSAVFSGAGNPSQPGAKPVVKAKKKARPRKRARHRKRRGGAVRSGGHVKRRRG